VSAPSRILTAASPESRRRYGRYGITTRSVFFPAAQRDNGALRHASSAPSRVYSFEGLF